ncbi:MAG TPA: Crp/Fnr family transcriptional regulator [Pyrinomonadaceae bacterium]|nr:Crp/Fnr family transcriptional regulator [Pyrinomonadaceae bacterium]
MSNLSLLHPRGKVLFAEGEPARGVFVLRSGKAAVSISSSEGRLVILRLAQAGDVLGLNAVLRNSPHETTVKTLGSCRTDYISRDQLLELMHKSKLAADAVVKILSYELTELTNRTRLLLLPQTALGRLAKLLLEWSKETATNGSQAGRIDRDFTQEEIAQMICSSRETVTRLLARLSRRQLIRMNSDSILICDHAALETIALS